MKPMRLAVLLVSIAVVSVAYADPAIDESGYLVREIGPTDEVDVARVCEGMSECDPRFLQPWVRAEVAGLLTRHGVDLDAFVAATGAVYDVRHLLDCPDGARLLILHRCQPDACATNEAFILVDAETREVNVIWVRERGLWIRGPRYPMLRELAGWFLETVSDLEAR